MKHVRAHTPITQNHHVYADFLEAVLAGNPQQGIVLEPGNHDEVADVLQMLEHELSGYADPRQGGSDTGSPRGRGRGRGPGRGRGNARGGLGGGALGRGIQLQIEELVDLAHETILAR